MKVGLSLLSTMIFFFFNDTATTEIYTLSLHDALPISAQREPGDARVAEHAQYRHQRLGIARPHPELRGTAHANAGARRERDVAQHLAARGALEGGDQLDHARPPPPRSASSSSPTCVTSPAPRVSTRSPVRTRPCIACASAPRSGTKDTSRWPQARTASCSFWPD